MTQVTHPSAVFHTSAPRQRTSVDVEKLLHWAYRDELSKRQTSSAEGIWSSIAEYGQRGGIDVGDGTAQRYPHFGLPHPDAERIERAIEALENTLVPWELTARDLMPDLADLFTAHLAARDYLLVSSFDTATLIRHHAIMGDRPAWYSDRPLPRRVRPPRGPGQSVVIGEYVGHGRWKAGAACPIRWDPSPVEIAMRRGAYAAWWDGLSRLAEGLRLADHVALPPSCAPRPWLKGGAQGAVLSAGGPRPSAIVPLKPARETAVGAQKRRLGSAVPREEQA